MIIFYFMDGHARSITFKDYIPAANEVQVAGELVVWEVMLFHQGSKGVAQFTTDYC
jgi:hypothetical protein